MFIWQQIMLFTIISFLAFKSITLKMLNYMFIESFLASKSITLKMLNYMFIEFIIYAPHIVEVNLNGLQSRHSLALLLYYARIPCKQTNH